MLVVGYNLTDPAGSHWILKNTWGAAWGDGGYFYLPMADPHIVNPCGILNYLSYPVLDGGGCVMITVFFEIHVYRFLFRHRESHGQC